jgi:hypothetical protein
MMGFRRGRSDRPRNRFRPESRLEALEGRQLLAMYGANYLSEVDLNGVNKHYVSSALAQDTRMTHRPALTSQHPIGTNFRQLSFLDNDGKVLTGQDREGDQWQITVHGPGVIVVTDATPNDGVLGDDIDTIQIIGSDIDKTYVTGQVTASARVRTDGTVLFNRLIALDGVSHIQLNGFTLAQTVVPAANANPNAGPEIYLPSGVRFLSFHDVYANIDTALNTEPVEIVIGQPNSPLTVQPTLRIDSIYNTVYNSDAIAAPGQPQTTPTVSIEVNGHLRSLEMVSATQAAIEPAGYQYQYPQSSTTGRTAIRALGITNKARAVGSLRNTTFSRSEQPFTSSTSGMRRLGSLEVGGKTDGLGVDVGQGNIGRIRLLRGLGDPTGALTGGTYVGIPENEKGYAAYGLMGGLVVAQRVNALQAGPANTVLQTSQDPSNIQARRTNWTNFYSRPGRAMTNAAVVTDGSVGNVDIVGDLQSSEIKTGANYQALLQGLEPVRSPSQIRNIRVRGNLVDSVVSATYSPGPDRNYGTIIETTSGNTTDDEAGPGRIAGRLQHGGIYLGGSKTVLNNTGTGFYAARKAGYLPPPEAAKRIHGGVNVESSR